jgi:hypothetical protein
MKPKYIISVEATQILPNTTIFEIVVQLGLCDLAPSNASSIGNLI